MKLNQPKALPILFGTELWERFGFYSLLSIFTIYLTSELGMSDGDAFLLFGVYTAFAYLTPSIGGMAADRVLGYGPAILLGAALMSVGYLVLAAGGPTAIYLGLAVLIVGNGFFKANVSALLGQFYDAEDPRRSAGFTLFYMGINLGALAGGLVAGWVAQEFGYALAFLMAGAGKGIAFVTYLLGRRHLEKKDVAPIALGKNVKGLVAISLGCAVVVAGVFFLLSRPQLAGTALGIGGTLVMAGYIVLVLREERRVRNPLLAHIVLVLFAIAFFTVYMQSATSVMLYTDREVQLTAFGLHIPPGEFTSLNPAFILIFSPVLALLWPWLAGRGIRVDDIVKFTVGLLLIGAAYLVLRLGVFETPDGAKTTLFWVVAFYWVYTMAELFLSPVGLALTTQLAPRHLAGMAMGIWMLSISAANYLSGLLAQLSIVPEGTASAEEVGIYASSFLIFGAIGLAAGILLLLASPFLRRLMRPKATPAER